MKKLAQITMYGDNYGACLQALALQLACKKQGVELQLLNYRNQDLLNVSRRKTIILKASALGIRGVVKYLKNYSFIQRRKKAYALFRREHLNICWDEVSSNSNWDELNGIFDGFICGSDMIWSEEFSNDWDFYYLSFAEKRKSFSYGPSFGNSEIAAIHKKRIQEYLSDFSIISCREDSGVAFIKNLGFDATLVVDPTLLIDKKDWNSYIDDNKRIIEERYCFAYLFGKQDFNRKKLLTMVDERCNRVYKLPSNIKEEKVFPVQSIGPIEFLRLFRDAESIITDTFHGLMFSIIFRKPFIVLNRDGDEHWARYSERITSTLRVLKMENRYVNPQKADLHMLKSIDYSIAEKRLQEITQKSYEYLKRIIGEL